MRQLPLAALGVIALFAICGCRVSSMPLGGGYTSAQTQKTIRLAIHEAFREAKLARVAGKTVSITSVGFDADNDDLREYVRLYAQVNVEKNGGQLVTHDPQLHAKLIVHACGTDLVTTYVVPFWVETDEDATFLLDVIVRDHAGVVLSKSRLEGRARYRETRWFMYFSAPGHFSVQRDDSWISVSSAWKDWHPLDAVPIDLGSAEKAEDQDQTQEKDEQ